MGAELRLVTTSCIRLHFITLFQKQLFLDKFWKNSHDEFIFGNFFEKNLRGDPALGLFTTDFLQRTFHNNKNFSRADFSQRTFHNDEIALD